MRYIGLLNDDGSIREEGFGPDNVDFTAIIGRPPQPGDRWIDGKGSDEESARKDAEFSFTTESNNA